MKDGASASRTYSKYLKEVERSEAKIHEKHLAETSQQYPLQPYYIDVGDDSVRVRSEPDTWEAQEEYC